MKLNIRHVLKCFACVLSLLPSFLHAQGILTGTVRDSLSGETLIGANVFLPGTALGSASDREGQYRISNVPAGTYVLRVSYVGYKTSEYEISVSSGEVKQNVLLTPDILEGEEVVVTAQARGQVAAINQQLTSNTIVNVVSEERIQELPDVNAAEVIGRLPGVSILRSGGEATKVVLRGLSDRFSTVTIDGIRIPPTEADTRGVDLSTISQGSLAGVELFKALTPDKDADAIAGSVNLVTRKAPSERLVRLDAKGDYNRLMDAYDQYDFSLRYGERFLNDNLGVQVTGNLERRNRSNELINLDYNQALSNGNDYEITDFNLQFTDEIRIRNGVGLLLDLITPDSGTVRISNIVSNTKRDYLVSTRNYPHGTGNLITYTARDREKEIRTFNSSIQGDNRLLGIRFQWGGSFAQSKAEDPYDYFVDFLESSQLDPITGQPISGMRGTPSIKDHPERLISYALNNYGVAYLNNAYYRSEKNLDKERTAFLNLSESFLPGSSISFEIKVGGKYKYKDRIKNTGQLYAPYYLGFWRDFLKAADGSIVPKDLNGTWFETFYQRFISSGMTSRTPFASDFLDPSPKYRDLYDLYSLRPIVNRDALRLWYELNKNGVNAGGNSPEYYNDPEVSTDHYDITERLSSAFVMNTMNLGQDITVIAGVRVEKESNDYRSKFAPSAIGGFPIPAGVIRDTAASHTETIWMPNLHVTIRPTEFLNIRVAAYRAVSRPDFNMRLLKFVARGSGTSNSVTLGNSSLRTAKAWNYEVNTSAFSNTIGLVSFSAFYKDIRDLFHMLNQAATQGSELVNGLGIYGWPIFSGPYLLTVPYNSPRPTRVWGFEFEHQMNFAFLPSPFQNIVLSYNASIVRSETYLISTQVETTFTTVPGFPFPIPVYKSVVVDKKQKLEGQPEFYGNISLGYDIGGFSARVSMFHQSEFNQSFSATGIGDQVINSFTRFDLAVKYQVLEYLAIMVNVNNLTNVEDKNSIYNRLKGWKLLNTAELYGTTMDVGVRLTL